MAITLQTAEEEYRKNPDIRKEDITRLKEWLDRQPHLPNLTEVDLIVFYHSCNCSMELTKTTIDLNLSLRTHLKYYFTNRDPIDKANVGGYDLCCLVALPELTAEGYKVFYTVLMDTDPTHFNLELAVKAFVNVSDLVQWEEGSFPGVVIIIDLQGVVFGHVTRLNIMTLKDVLFYLQEAMPVRLKGVHFMNAPSFMDRILALMRPFIKRELLTILHIHTPRVPGVPGTMDRHVAQSTLPREAGGEYQCYEKIRANTLFRMKENRQLLIDEQQLRVQENRRPGKPKDLSSIYGVEGSFKKLDID